MQKPDNTPIYTKKQMDEMKEFYEFLCAEKDKDIATLFLCLDSAKVVREYNKKAKELYPALMPKGTIIPFAPIYPKAKTM